MFAAISLKKTSGDADAKVMSIAFVVGEMRHKEFKMMEKKQFNMNVKWPEEGTFGDFDKDYWKNVWECVDGKIKETLQTNIKTANDVRDYIDSLKEKNTIFLSKNLVSDVIALDRLIGNSTLYRSQSKKRIQWVCVESLAYNIEKLILV